MKSNKINSISVFFPAFNEEDNVEKSVCTAKKILQARTQDFEIIVINDGSNDETQNIVETLAREDQRVILASHKKNQGYGKALISGFEAASKDLIFFTDCDLQFDLNEIDKLLKHISDFDVVIGFRSPRKDPFMRILNGWGWKMLNQFLFNLNVKDIDCAFKLFKKEAIKKIKIESHGAMVSAEFLIKLRDKGAKIKEVAVSHYPRKKGSQTGAKPAVILRAFKELFKFHVKYNTRK